MYCSHVFCDIDRRECVLGCSWVDLVVVLCDLLAFFASVACFLRSGQVVPSVLCATTPLWPSFCNVRPRINLLLYCFISREFWQAYCKPGWACMAICICNGGPTQLCVLASVSRRGGRPD